MCVWGVWDGGVGGGDPCWVAGGKSGGGWPVMAGLCCSRMCATAGGQESRVEGRV